MRGRDWFCVFLAFLAVFGGLMVIFHAVTGTSY